MSHEVETHTNADGTVEAAAVFAREDAWHRLGTTFDRDLTTDDVLVAGHLGGWDVRKEPVQTVGGLIVPDKFATVRTNPFTGEAEAIGGVVGNTYVPIQNEDTLPLLDAVLDETEGRYETAGSLRNGRNVFVTVRPKSGTVLLGGVDPVDRYLTLLNFHDGTGSLTLLDTHVRVVCKNTQAAALHGFASKVSIWHTAKSNKSIAEIRDALKITFAYDAAFEAEAEKMIQTSLTEAQFVKTIRLIWPTEKDAEKTRAVGIQERREAELTRLFGHSLTNEKIRNTRWGGYQAVTEYLDWYTPLGKTRDAELVRAERTVATNGRVTDVKEAAFAKFAVK